MLEGTSAVGGRHDPTDICRRNLSEALAHRGRRDAPHGYPGARPAGRPSARAALWAGSRIAIRSCHAPTMRRLSGGAVGSTDRVIDGRGDGRHRLRPQQPDGVVDRRPPSAEVLGDHRIEAENRRVHRDTVDVLEVRNQCRHRTSHGHPGYRDRGRLRPQPSHQGADLGDHAHHSRDVGQRVHVRILRPRSPACAVARLDRQGDVEAQLVSDPPGAGEQQVQRADPDRPRAPTPATACGRRRFGTGVPPRSRGRRVLRWPAIGEAPDRGRTSASRRSADPACAAEWTSPARVLVRYALPQPRARTVPRPQRRTTPPTARAWAAARSTSFRTGPTRRASPRPVGEHRWATAVSSHPSFSTRCVHAAARPRSHCRCARRVLRSSSTTRA